MRFLVALSGLLATALSQPVEQKNVEFNPYAFTKNFVECPAVDRSGPQPKDITLRLGYLDINPGAKKTLIMLHGWPSLWTTYRNQIQAFGGEYRLLIPEHRGFGQSEHPEDLFSSNTMPDFVNDVLCMMRDAHIDRGVCVGNDFGAQVCWEAGRMRPDKFIGVFNVGIPYVSAALGFISNDGLVQLVPDFGYTLYLSNNATGAASELNADPRSAIRSCAQIANSTLPSNFLSETTSFLGPWRDLEKELNLKEIPFSGIMTPLVEDYMVSSYEIQGFFNTFNGYQANNRNETFEFEVSQGNFTIPQPTFSLYPTKDPVAPWAQLAAELNSAAFLGNHFNTTIATAHWPHEELPEQFNAIFKQWIGNVTAW